MGYNMAALRFLKRQIGSDTVAFAEPEAAPPANGSKPKRARRK